MFGLGKAAQQSLSLACFLSDNGYSLVGLENNQSIRFCEERSFSEPTPELISASLSADVDKYSLYGCPCRIILSPSLYQLLLMDAPEVAENEMAKALRWQLKGLIEYPLNDIVVEAFIVPPHGAGLRRKKVFCTAALQSALINKLNMLENCLLSVVSITIAELVLSRLLSFEPLAATAPTIVISFDDELCQLHVYYEGFLYLLRTLSMSKTIMQPNSFANQDMLLEIQRSIDYCLMELKLPEPKLVLFTPSFYEASDLFTFLQAELDKEVKLMDVNTYFKGTPIKPNLMARAFYAIGGALDSSNKETNHAID